MSVHSAGTRTVRGACPQDCPDTCAFIYHVEDGKLVEVTGDPAHPMTRGGLCVKLKDFAEHHYNPDRILYPMKRVGPKGSGKYERISWDEALSTIKSKWTKIIDQYGSPAIMPHAYLGNRAGERPHGRRRFLQPPRVDRRGEDLLRIRIFDSMGHDRGPDGGPTSKVSPTRNISSCGA